MKNLIYLPGLVIGVLLGGGVGYWLGSANQAPAPTLPTVAAKHPKSSPAMPDPTAAQPEPTPTKPQAALANLHELAEADPAAALLKAGSLTGSESKGAANAAARKLVKTNPVLAAELASKLIATHIGADPFEHVANDWAALDPQAAAAWGQSYQGPSKGGFLLRAWHGLLASDLGKNPQNLQQAVATLREILPHREEGDWDYAVGQVMESLVGRQWETGGPAQTIQMLENLSDVEPRAAKTAWKMLGTWLNQDSVAASTWVDQLPRDERRDRYVFRLLKFASTQDPDSVPRWIETLSTPEQQQIANQAMARNGGWPRFD